MIVEDSIRYLRVKYPDMLKLTIADLRIGSYLAVVKLSNDSIGLASSETTHETKCDKKNRDFGEFTPLHIVGRSIESLFSTTKTNDIVRTLRIAVLNAISASINEKENLKIIRNTDPIDMVKLVDGMKVTLVGAFHSYIKRISNSGSVLRVLELEKEALLPEHQKYYVPADSFPEVLGDSDLVFITGLTMVNNTFNDLLRACKSDSKIVVVGPSGNLISSVLFEKGVDIIGASSVTHPEIVFDLVSQGAGGYYLFEYCVEKICIINEKNNRA